MIAYPDSEPIRHTVARTRAAVDEVGATPLQRHARRMVQKATCNSIGRVPRSDNRPGLPCDRDVVRNHDG